MMEYSEVFGGIEVEDVEVGPEVIVAELLVELLYVEVALETPTQYESPTQKFTVQSEDTAGFHSRN
jgi:hypothetical protein